MRITGGKPTTSRKIDFAGKDCYSTPQWATHALMLHEHFEGVIWDCACGEGLMAGVLGAYGNPVLSTDLYEYGYGRPNLDFLTIEHRATNIVTNPPYFLAEEFIKKGLQQADDKLALLLRLDFLESQGRYERIYSLNRPSRVWVFTERLTMYPKGVEVKGSGSTAYAWFVWDINNPSENTIVNWFPLGYRKQFS